MARLVAFVQSDCPTCRLIVPYLNTLARNGVPLRGFSQDDHARTQNFSIDTGAAFPLELDDRDWEQSRHFNIVTVPSLVVVDDDDKALRVEPGFDKQAIKRDCSFLRHAAGGNPWDGFPASKPGCSSRHLELPAEGEDAPALDAFRPAANRRGNSISMAMKIPSSIVSANSTMRCQWSPPHARGSPGCCGAPRAIHWK